MKRDNSSDTKNLHISVKKQTPWALYSYLLVTTVALVYACAGVYSHDRVLQRVRSVTQTDLVDGLGVLAVIDPQVDSVAGSITDLEQSILSTDQALSDLQAQVNSLDTVVSTGDTNHQTLSDLVSANTAALTSAATDLAATDLLLASTVSDVVLNAASVTSNTIQLCQLDIGGVKETWWSWHWTDITGCSQEISLCLGDTTAHPSVDTCLDSDGDLIRELSVGPADDGAILKVNRMSSGTISLATYEDLTLSFTVDLRGIPVNSIDVSLVPATSEFYILTDTTYTQLPGFISTPLFCIDGHYAARVSNGLFDTDPTVCDLRASTIRFEEM